MKTKIVLPLLAMFILIGCSDKSSDITQNVGKKKTRSLLNESSLSEDFGNLHNQGVLEFCSYVEEQGINPFDEGVFTDALISDFVDEFVEQNLILENYEDILVDEVIIDENKLHNYKSQIFQLFDSNMSVEEVNLAIDMLLRNYTEDESTQAGELPIIVAITGIAKATNTLWRQDWDPTYHPFIPDDLQYTAADTTTSTDQEEENEELRELAKADVAGAISGGVSGFLTTWTAQGALLGALVGAVSASITEKVMQDVDLVAMRIDEGDIPNVNANSYFYNYLHVLRESNPDIYYQKYGEKFECVL
jgi:hypothetical protein